MTGCHAERSGMPVRLRVDVVRFPGQRNAPGVERLGAVDFSV